MKDIIFDVENIKNENKGYCINESNTAFGAWRDEEFWR